MIPPKTEEKFPVYDGNFETSIRYFASISQGKIATFFATNMKICDTIKCLPDVGHSEFDQ